MKSSFAEVLKIHNDRNVSMRLAANILGLSRVAEATRIRGLYPCEATWGSKTCAGLATRPARRMSSCPTGLTFKPIIRYLEVMTDQSVIDRKRAILDAARTVFSRKGYSATAVDDVAEEARIAKGTLYLYFKSKEALYLAALASDIRAMVAAGREEMEKTESLRDKLRAFLRVRMEYCRSRQEFLRIYLAEYGSLFVKNAPSRELVDLLQDNIRYVSTVIRRASRRGEIGPVPAGAAAAALIDLSRGLMERRLLGWDEFRAPDEIEFSIDLLFSGIQNYAKSTAKRSKQASKREGRRVGVA